jgi:hypothetical protein
MGLFIEILRMVLNNHRRKSVRVPEAVFLRQVILILIVFLASVLTSILLAKNGISI